MNPAAAPFRKVRQLLLIFVAVLLVSFHYFLIYFINSTYLHGVFSESTVGFVFAGGTVLNIILFLLAPRLLRKRGDFKFTLWLTILEIAALVGLAFSPSGWGLVFFFLIQQMTAPVLFYCLEMFLERFTDQAQVGSVRGMSLTMMNIPPIIAPFIAGLILVKPDYWKIYLISAAFLIPFLVILVSYFKNFNDPVYPSVGVKEVVSKFYSDKAVFDVFVDRLLLNIFYGWMVIYMPLYLLNHVGFTWSQIGTMLAIALLPFILFQASIGRAADKYHDEKQVLIIGFLTLVVSTVLMAFLVEANIVIWTALLFAAYTGAALVEVSSESYFFKHVHPENAGFIGIYRMTRALPYLLISPLAALTLYFFDFKYMFLVLGAIMLIGIRYAGLLRN